MTLTLLLYRITFLRVLFLKVEQKRIMGTCFMPFLKLSLATVQALRDRSTRKLKT